MAETTIRPLESQDLPDAAQLNRFRAALAAGRPIPDRTLALLREAIQPSKSVADLIFRKSRSDQLIAQCFLVACVGELTGLVVL